MNYRHAFHAGNFGDCLKHALLVWLIRALQRKPGGISVLDTHAGAGRYELSDGPATRTGEFLAGIARLLDDPPEALADYVALVAGLDSPSPEARAERDQHCRLRRYPGSPMLARALLRPQDRLVCCELHPDDVFVLRDAFAGDRQVAVHRRDAWEALGALLPPPERRGLVLVDPPYEAPDEFDQLAAGLRLGHARFATGVFAAWYPIKHRAPVRAFRAAMRESGIRDIVAAGLWLREPLDPARLNGCGVLVVNPPYRFEAEAPNMLAALLERLGTGEPGEGFAVERLADE